MSYMHNIQCVATLYLRRQINGGYCRNIVENLCQAACKPGSVSRT